MSEATRQTPQRAKLTKTAAERAVPRSGKTDDVLWDSKLEGFGIRVRAGRPDEQGRPTYRRSWIVQRRLGRRGPLTKITLGTFPGMRADTAREEAEMTIEQLTRGLHPVREREQMPSVQDFAEKYYLPRYAQERKRTAHSDELMLKKHVYPRIGRLKVDDVHRRDLVAIVDAVADSGAPIQARKVRALLSVFFRFALRRGLIEMSPAHDIEVPTADSKQPVLDHDQIKALWKSTAPGKMPDDVRLPLRLLLLTGQRPGEVLGIPVDEIDLEAGMWRLPGERRKRGKQGVVHEVPLSEGARSVIAEALESTAAEGWLFARRDGKGPQRTDGPVYRELKELFPDAGLHSFRRVVATELSDQLGYHEEDIARVLGHYPKTVTGGYIQRTTTVARKALNAWDRHLAAIVDEPRSGDVLEFPAADQPAS